MDYASFLIDCTTQTLAGKLQKLQNRGLRISRYNNMYERCSATGLHDHFKVERFDKRRLTQLLCHMYENSATRGVTVPVEKRRTRADEKVKFNIGNYKYAAMKKSPLYRGGWEWDELLPDIQKSKNKTSFKKSVKGKQHRILLV